LGYDGAFLAEEQDVIVVTFKLIFSPLLGYQLTSESYRENFFGFAALPGLPNYNFGLLDQRLAVEWVSKNIEAFGGDPARILLFGQSTGGGSVDIYSYAWTEDPIVNARRCCNSWRLHTSC
jgi:cholinesterase